MTTCKKCNTEFKADLHDDPDTGDLKLSCPKCGAKHTARKLPTPAGAPAEYEVSLAEGGGYDHGNG